MQIFPSKKYSDCVFFRQNIWEYRLLTTAPQCCQDWHLPSLSGRAASLLYSSIFTSIFWQKERNTMIIKKQMPSYYTTQVNICSFTSRQVFLLFHRSWFLRMFDHFLKWARFYQLGFANTRFQVVSTAEAHAPDTAKCTTCSPNNLHAVTGCGFHTHFTKAEHSRIRQWGEAFC